MKNAAKKIMAILSIIVMVMAGYFLWARPYQMRWGATDEEVARAMPGDELDSHPTFLATRAITINVSPEAIWPWLVQMGFNRAGFYGYDIVEGIGSYRGMHSANRIVPELQHIAVGDTVPISLVAATRIFAIEPDSFLIWAENEKDAPNGGFTWALYPLDSHHTRLVSRIRWSHHWTQPGIFSLDLLTEFTDHLALSEILRGIKVRAEGRKITPMATQTIKFLFYLVAALLFLAVLLRLFIQRLTTTGYLLCLIAGAIWLIIWYAPVPIWIGAFLELLVLWGLIRGLVRPNTQEKSVHHKPARSES